MRSTTVTLRQYSKIHIMISLKKKDVYKDTENTANSQKEPGSSGESSGSAIKSSSNFLQVTRLWFRITASIAAAMML